MSFLNKELARWLLATAMLSAPLTANAEVYNLTVDRVRIDTGNFVKTGVGFNGASPGPVLRFKEGEKVTINVKNNLDESTSVHWHGLILPFQQDGVPTISYDGIGPGETFTYNFPIVQSGTYWFHSHSSLQEPDGAYGAIIIEPKGREPFRYDREYVVQLTDAHPHSAHRIMRNLKMSPDYYNRMQRTISDFFSDIAKKGFGATLADRGDWGEMRMMPTDIEDVQGFTALINGHGPAQNWTGIFKPGERVRLRFINSSAMAYFDIRIPGLKMTVVNADGNNVRPVRIDEFRIAVAETYDVIVRPTEDKAYTIFAETMGRSTYARGTLAPRKDMTAAVPKLRKHRLLTMADMGMAHEGMDHGAMKGMDHSQHSGMDKGLMKGMDHSQHSGMDKGPMKGMDHSQHSGIDKSPMKGMDHSQHSGMGKGPMKGMDHSQHSGMRKGPMKGMDHSQHSGMDKGPMKGMDHSRMTGKKQDPFYAPGSGLMPEAANGGKFLSYQDLKAQKPLYKLRAATREIEIRLTGNMERYIWSLNGVKYGDAEPIRLKYGERVRFKFVNQTMMTHPMHLHGMWSILDTGAGKWNPIKHVISVAPGTTVHMETEVDAPGQWAFHCHLSYHAAAGMFRKVIVEGGPQAAQIPTVR